MKLRRRPRRLGAALLLLLAMACGGPPAAPPGRPPAAALAPLGAAAAARLRPAWSVDLGSALAGPPAVAGNLAVVTTESGEVAAFSAGDGSPVWRVKGLPSLTGGPTVAGGKVFAGSSDGHLYAFALTDGGAIWDWRAPGVRPSIAARQAVFRGLLIVGVGSPPGGGAETPGRLVALDPASGNEIWSTCARVGCAPGGGIREAPVVDPEGHLFAIAGAPANDLWALDVGLGRTLWRVPLSTPPGGAPALLSSGAREAVLAGGLQAFDARQGRPLWSRPSIGPAAGDASAVYAAAGSSLVGLRAGDGQPLWSAPLDFAVAAAPVVGGGVVVIGGGGPGRGVVAALATADGHALWSFQSGSPPAGSPLLSGASLYVAEKSGILRAFR